MISAEPPDSVPVLEVGEGHKESLAKKTSLEKDSRNQVKAAPRASYAEATQEKKVMRKYNFDITDLEGQLIVEVPDEVVVNAEPLWEDFLIGKFLDTAPHIARIHAVVNKIWRDGGKGKPVEVYEVDSTTMKFKVSDEQMRARILRRGMWSIGNIPLVVTKWSPTELEEKPEVKTIPLWVHLKNVPMNMYSWKGLSFITSAVGRPDRLHPETASCSNFKLAKVFVMADLSKELPKKINFTKNGQSSLVEFIYPWLPDRCHTCGKWGHVEKVCIINKKEASLKTVREIIVEGYKARDERDGVKRVEETAVTKGMDAGETNSLETETVGEKNCSVKSTEKTPEVENNGGIDQTVLENDIEEGEVVKDWEEVTPGKTSKGQKVKSPEYAQMISPSRYSALACVDDNGELLPGEESKDTENEEEETVSIAAEMQSEKSSQEIADTISEMGLSVEGQQERSNMKGKAGGEGSHLRPSLPRTSKTFHKIVPDHSSTDKGISHPGKRSSRKPSQ